NRSDAPACTTPRMFASATVTAGNVTDPDEFAASVIGRVSISRPSTSSLTGSALTAAKPRLVNPAVTLTRSSPENDLWSNVTDDTTTSLVSPDATEIGVSVAPSGK